MPHFRSRRNDLHRYEAVLASRFLDDLPLDSSLSLSQKEELHLKGYCILLHAAIEEFVEQTVLEVVDLHCEMWGKRTKLKPTVVLLALLAHMGDKFKEPPVTTIPTVIVKSSILERLDFARKAFVRLVHNNHGAGLQHLKTMSRPAAIPIDLDPDTNSALSQLKSYRGEYAHSGRITKVPSVKDLKNISRLCLRLCDQIANSAVANCEGI